MLGLSWIIPSLFSSKISVDPASWVLAYKHCYALYFLPFWNSLGFPALRKGRTLHFLFPHLIFGIQGLHRMRKIKVIMW